MGAIVSTLAFPYPPKRRSAKALRARGNQLIFLETTKSKHRIPAIHIQRRSATFTILYSHGNAEDVGICLRYLDAMSNICKANVLAYEYPGYSVAQGKPSEENCYQAIQAAYQYLTTQAGVPPSKIVVFGRSLGTGPSVDLCSRLVESSQGECVAGCILQSPLESAIRCAIGCVTACTLYPIDIFQNYLKVDRIRCPVFILHGADDKVVPCANGRNLYQQLQERSCHSQVAYEPIWLPGRGHNDMPQVECLQHCREFILFLKERQQHASSHFES